MIILKLAIRNILGAGLRTWLNVIVLSFSFIAIIFMQGMYIGMGDQMIHAMVDAEIAGGQYWHESYDPYDPLSLQDAHGSITQELKGLIEQKLATPILILPATIYPNGRIRTIQLRGIDPSQDILSIPSSFLAQPGEEDTAGTLPVLIGSRMSKSTGLKIGDYVPVRWRDEDGTFDARDAKIVQVMSTTVPTIDQGQFWVPLDRLQELTGMEGNASLIVLGKDVKNIGTVKGWELKTVDFLIQDVEALVRSKSTGASILYVVLLALAMLAIFDTQVLSIFRRKKEMGTLMAMGMTRGRIVQLFTLEGALHSVLAALLAALYGIPLLIWFSDTGWTLPQGMDDYGFALGEKIFPVYSAGLVLGTTALVLIVTTIVSFLPTRRIVKLKPTDALRGRMS